MKGGFCLTSSRDENQERQTAPPQTYVHPFGDVVYPKDLKAGGTWVAAGKCGRVACLLNGAFEPHPNTGHYERSRGKILLEFFDHNQINSFIEKVSLKNVEPFTLLMLDHKSGTKPLFFELRWDGEKKHVKKLCSETEYIWSSSTLYSHKAREARLKLFNDWVEKYKDFDDRLIGHFHSRKHGLDIKEDILMCADTGVKTVSISQVRVCHNEEIFNYTDLKTNESCSVDLKRTIRLSA